MNEKERKELSKAVDRIVMRDVRAFLKEQGLTIVPIEPTEKMISGGDMESCVLEDKVIVRIYKAMIAKGAENG